MTDRKLFISSHDHKRLSLLLAAFRNGSRPPTVRRLQEELERAIILAPHEMPPRVVRLDSRVTFEDLTDGSVECYTLTLPEQANADEHRLSILAPIGTALLGYAEGDELDWETPGGVRRLRILTVDQTIVAEPVHV